MRKPIAHYKNDNSKRLGKLLYYAGNPEHITYNAIRASKILADIDDLCLELEQTNDELERTKQCICYMRSEKDIEQIAYSIALSNI